jgi:hypothetical protein
MNEPIRILNYPDKLYYVCLELDLGILELQKTEDECDDSCVYKYEDEFFDVGFDNIVEYVKEIAEEDGEEYDEYEQDFSLSYDGAKKIAVFHLNQQIIELEKNIANVKNRIISLS